MKGAGGVQEGIQAAGGVQEGIQAAGGVQEGQWRRLDRAGGGAPLLGAL